jgi:hypothetical protein
MRGVIVLLVGVVCVAGGGAQEATPGKRYGVEADLKTYPQNSPKDTLASVLQAIDNKQIDYLLAHLADPQFVDRRVEASGFEETLKEAKTRLLDDPSAAKQLRRFLKDGEWHIADGTATVRLKDVTDRWVYLRKADGRWFLENRWKPTVEEKEKN